MVNRFGYKGKRSNDDEEPIRVTDRRRINLDENPADDPSTNIQPPSLKPSYVEELEARTLAAEQKVQEVNTRFEQLRKHLQNETDQTRQRLNKAADERARGEKADFIAALLPVLDNLERASEAAASGASTSDIAEGVRRVATSFENALASVGVERVDAVGQDFNPELHEAVETAETGPEEEGKVIVEYSRGYRIGDRLLRPAKVKVGASSRIATQAGE